MNKKLLSSAVLTAMGLGMAATTAQAASVTHFTLADVGSNSMGSGGYLSATDGVVGAFGFTTKYCNVKTYSNCASKFTGNAGTGTILGGNAANPTGSFSTGFSFGVPFIPFTGTSGAGDVNFAADITNGALTVTDLGFGGQFSGAYNFDLAPDTNFPLEILWTVARTNAGEFDVAMRWGHIITTAEDGTGMFTGQNANWVVEGCMSTTGSQCATSAVPVPAAVWLFGSGLVGLAGVARRRKNHKV